MTDLKPGNEVVDFFVLRKKEIKEYNGQKFLKLELGDRTGRIDAVAWDNPQEIYETAETGEIVKIRGSVTTYRDSSQLKIERLRRADQKEVELSDFLPSSEKDPGVLLEEFRAVVGGIQNPHLKRLLEFLLEDSAIARGLKETPGGKLWHHAYLGGLLEHTLNVVQICEKAAAMYRLVNRDLLIAGALLHDVGKISSYSTRGFFDYTDEGRLVGHIVSGEELIARKIEQIPDFPAELALRLKHLILAHQGQLEFASPVVPQTIEAIILYYADDMDAKANAFSRIITTQKDKGKKWSDWVRLIDRFIYLGEEEESGE